MQLCVNLVRIMADQQAEKSGAQNIYASWIFDSCLKILAYLCIVTSLWKHSTQKCAAAFFKTSIPCCLFLSYMYTKAVTWLASNQTGLLKCTWQSCVLRRVRRKKLHLCMFVNIYIYTHPYTHTSSFQR